MFSVIFDMDGTLLDTQRVCIPAWDFAGEKQGFKNVGEHIQFVCGNNEAGWTKYLKDHFPTLDIKAFCKDARDYVIEHIVVRYKEGAEELLYFLKSKGVKIALASGSSHGSIDHHLNVVGSADLFDVKLGGADVENGKPAPDIFLLAAKVMGVDPKECYVIEDAANGIKAGYAAGMKCIGVPDIVPFSEETKALLTAEFTSLREALPFFEKLL